MSLLTNYVCWDFCKTLLVVDHSKIYQKKKEHNFLINDFAVILLIRIDNWKLSFSCFLDAGVIL